MKQFFILFASVAFIPISSGCSDSPGRAQRLGGVTDKPFIIAIAGSDVKDRFSDADMNIQQGWAMRTGVEAAYNMKTLARFRQNVELMFVNDNNDKETTRRVAREITTNPKILAVIGHSNSGMTRESAWIYEQANIPLLMPIATSPRAMFEPSEDDSRGHRLRNCFRLPPDDFQGQIRAIAWFVNREKKTRCRIVIDDMAEQAREYSKSFGKRLASLIGLSDNGIVYMSSQTRLQDIQAMLSQKPDFIIFCGYGRSAKHLGVTR